MPVTFNRQSATLSGVVGVEDAEPLAAWLRTSATRQVRMERCTHLHTAAVQALMALGAQVVKAPHEPFLARWVVPALAGAAAPGAGDAAPGAGDAGPDADATGTDGTDGTDAADAADGQDMATAGAGVGEEAP